MFDDDEVLYLIHKGFIVHQFVLKPVIQENVALFISSLYIMWIIPFVCFLLMVMYQMLL